MSDASISRTARIPGRRVLTTERLAFLLAAVAVFLSPYNVLRHPALYFTAADAVTLLAFLVLLVGGRLPLAPFAWMTPAWYAGFLAIVGGLMIGSIANQRLVGGLPVNAQYAFAMVILPLVLCRRDAREARQLLAVWAVSMAGVMLHGIYLVEFAVDPPFNLVSGAGRLKGVIERSNELAALGAMAVVVVLHLSAERALALPVALLLIGLLLYGIVLTASNTGVIALAAGVLTYTLFQRSARHYAAVAVVAGAVLLALLLAGPELLPQSFMNRVAGALTSGDLGRAGTFDDRMALTWEGWAVSRDHVFIGLGADGFRRISAQHLPVHNTYVLLLVEGGILSLAGLCLVLGATALRGATLVLDPPSRNLGALLLAIAAIFALVLNAVPHIYARFWFTPLVLVLSLGLAESRLLRRGRPLSERGRLAL